MWTLGPRGVCFQQFWQQHGRERPPEGRFLVSGIAHSVSLFSLWFFPAKAISVSACLTVSPPHSWYIANLPLAPWRRSSIFGMHHATTRVTKKCKTAQEPARKNEERNVLWPPPAKLFVNKRFSCYLRLPLPVCPSLLHSSWLFCSQLDILYREFLHTCSPTILLPHSPLSILLIATFVKCLDPCPLLWSHVNKVWYSNNDDDSRLYCSPLSSFKYSNSLLATALLTIPYVILTCTNGGFYITGGTTATFVSKRRPVLRNYHPLGEESSHTWFITVKRCADVQPPNSKKAVQCKFATIDSLYIKLLQCWAALHPKRFQIQPLWGPDHQL